MTNNRIGECEKIVKHQAEMQSLWLIYPNINEALLMAALRHLHAVIEGDAPGALAAKGVYWDVESEL